MAVKVAKDVEKVVGIVASKGAVAAFGHTDLQESRSVAWGPTLYEPLRQFYTKQGLTGSNTLVIGAGFGDEMPSDFRGVLLDLSMTGLKEAQTKLPNASPVRADGGKLPFRDGAFDNVVISLVLSQLDGNFEAYRDVIYSEARRVAAKRVIVIDSTHSIMTDRYDDSKLEHDLIDLAELMRDSNPRRIETFEWYAGSGVLHGEVMVDMNYTVEIFEALLRNGSEQSK